MQTNVKSCLTLSLNVLSALIVVRNTASTIQYSGLLRFNSSSNNTHINVRLEISWNW